MITEQCTNNAINITRTCIKGLNAEVTDVVVAFGVVLIVNGLAYLTYKIIQHALFGDLRKLRKEINKQGDDIGLQKPSLKG